MLPRQDYLPEPESVVPPFAESRVAWSARLNAGHSVPHPIPLKQTISALVKLTLCLSLTSINSSAGAPRRIKWLESKISWSR